jgi:hypothetical protein
MAKEKSISEEAPTMQSFTVGSLLDSIKEESDEQIEETDNDDEKDDDNDDNDNKTGQKDSKSDKPDGDSESDEDDSDDLDDDEDDEKDDDEVKKSKPKAKKKADEKDGDTDGDTEDDDDEAGTFWDDVDKLTGVKIEVDYQGVDPESPEGAVLREEAVSRFAIDNHLNRLKDLFPREFRALEHAANGGQLEDLFSPQEPDFSQVTIKEDDVDAQKAQMMSYYTNFKGFSPAKARRMVEADEDSEEGLFKASQDAIKERATVQEKQRAIEEENTRKRAEDQKKADIQMVNTISGVIKKGELGTFRVPKSEVSDFENFIFSSVTRNNEGGYTIVQSIDPSSLEKQLQAMYFAFKGGELSSIIQTAAKSERAKQTKRTLKRQKQQRVSDGDATRKSATPKAMTDFNA